jgi:hypothetical protein
MLTISTMETPVVGELKSRVESLAHPMKRKERWSRLRAGHLMGKPEK